MLMLHGRVVASPTGPGPRRELQQEGSIASPESVPAAPLDPVPWLRGSIMRFVWDKSDAENIMIEDCV